MSIPLHHEDRTPTDADGRRDAAAVVRDKRHRHLDVGYYTIFPPYETRLFHMVLALLIPRFHYAGQSAPQNELNESE